MARRNADETPRADARDESRNAFGTAAGVTIAAVGVVTAAAATDRLLRRGGAGAAAVPAGRRPSSDDKGRGSGRPTPHRPAETRGTGEQRSGERARTAVDPDAPNKPEGPEDLHKRNWVYALKKVLREFTADQCTDLAASLVYFMVLALFPALLAIVSILGLFGQAENTISAVGDILRQFSPDIAKTLLPIVEGLVSAPGAPLTFAVGVLGAIFSASGYVGAFGRAMNRIYAIDEGRPVWKLRPTQLIVTLVVVVLVVIGALILVLSGDVAKVIGDAIGLSDAFVFVFGIVKWPVLLAIAIVVVALLYYWSPNIRQPKFKWTSTGSIIGLLVWALASVGFGFYVANFGNYNQTYGSIAGVIIFLLWLWITNLALLFGAEFDAEVERSRELQAGLPAEEQIQLPPRDTRASDKKAKQHEEDVEVARELRRSRGRSDDPENAPDR